MKVRERLDNLESKFTPKIDIGMSNMLVEYTMSQYVSQLQLSAAKNFISLLHLEDYRTNYDIYNRLILSKMILHERLEVGVTQLPLIKMEILNTDSSLTEVADQFEWKTDKLTAKDTKIIGEFIDEKLRFYFFYKEMPEIIKIYKRIIDTNGFECCGTTLSELNERMCQLAQKMQPTTISTGLLRQFNFSDPNILDAMKFIVDKAQKPSSILQTGIRHLNALLGPGFRGSKLYVFLGMSGKFKSGTLLNLADMIRKYNPQLEKVVDGKRNTVLFITCENSIEETVERVFNMYSPADDKFLNSSLEDVYTAIHDRGGYAYTDESGIDVQIMYFANMEINTGRLYDIIDHMEEEGKHCICLIMDYIKKIDSVFNHRGDEVVRMTYVARELKSLAEFYNIPVITAQQINRNGNATIDAAMRDGKQDLIRYLGNADIGGAWGVIEECDWVGLINLERSIKTGQMYLSIKNTKNRIHRDGTISDYFNHPFCSDNELRLETDLEKEASLSIMSIASDLESVEIDEVEETQERPKFVRTSVSSNDIIKKISVCDNFHMPPARSA